MRKILRHISERVANTALGTKYKETLSKQDFPYLRYFKKYGDGPSIVSFLQILYRNEKGGVFLSPREAWNIYSLARAQSLLGKKHAYAEVGVFSGLSAEIICKAKPPRTELFLFDTFTGLPSSITQYDRRYKAGMFESSRDDVERRLGGYNGWHILEGLFPDTAHPVEKKTFSFVHLDVDLHKSTVDALSFFWPRMASGGIILSHDYSQAEGVNLAFTKFFEKRTDHTLLELSTTQVVAIKREESPTPHP